MTCGVKLHLLLPKVQPNKADLILVKHLIFTGHRGRGGNFTECRQYVKRTLHAKPPAPFTTHMWVVVHDQQVLSAPLRACPLVGSHKPGDVVMLQQRQPIDGAFIQEVLAVGCREHLHGHGPLVQRSAVDGAVSATPDQLKEEKLFITPLLL